MSTFCSCDCRGVESFTLFYLEVGGHAALVLEQYWDNLFLNEDLYSDEKAAEFVKASDAVDGVDEIGNVSNDGFAYRNPWGPGNGDEHRMINVIDKYGKDFVPYNTKNTLGEIVDNLMPTPFQDRVVVCKACEKVVDKERLDIPVSIRRIPQKKLS